MTLPVPPNEDARVRALRDYLVLDTTDEPPLTDLAQLAATICATPTAVMTLVFGDHVKFKARVGWTVTEAPRASGFCSHTILEPDVLIVPDASADPRFARDSLVTGPPHVRFYAGTALRTAEGHAIGTLAVMDYTPRTLTSVQVEAIRTLSRHVMSQLELRRRVLAEQAAASEASAQLRHAQKMEAIGRLAGGIAHDFNNILTVIQGHAALVLDTKTATREAAVDAVREIAEAADRAGHLTHQLLAFSRRQVLQFTNFDLNAVVAGLSTMWRRILGEDITVRVQASRIAPVIHGDPGMMEQVLMNLVVNAREAMTHGGRLDIITTVEPNDDVAVPDDARASASGRFVHLRVSDTGTGIAPEHLSRIFEPFFTTKEVHRGSGLGLATAYGIVRQHHGWITVRSEQGHGTTFDIYLPATDEPASRTVTSKRDEARVGGRETLLLIEDETAVRQLARTVLERHGYRTLDAIDGVNALEIWREHGHEIDVILTDMVLPEGISGIDVATRIRAERPDIPVIVTSGYSVEMAGKELLPDERITFLQKPYRPQQLLRVVRDTLDAVHSARRG